MGLGSTMTEQVSGKAESLSKHENVNGIAITLVKKRVGKSACIEYTVEKDKFPRSQYRGFYLLSAFVTFLSISVCLNLFWGMLSFASLATVIIYNLLWDIRKEVLLVTVPLGLQLTTFFHVGQHTSCFIPWHCVKDVYIIEAISLHRVLYNLVVLTECKDHSEGSKHEKLIPLFQGIKPRLSCLESIYQSIYSLLPETNQNVNEKLR